MIAKLKIMIEGMKIKAIILGILGVLAGGYLLLVTMVGLATLVTHSRMSQISGSLFPAALRMQEAEASFERMKKHYGDVVVLQDATSLRGAETDAEATATALGLVKTALGSSRELGNQADALLAQFSSLRSRDHDTYAAILNSAGNPSDDLMAQVGALGKDNKALTGAMGLFDKAISASFQKQLDTVDLWSVLSGVVGLVMLVFAGLSCSAAWWVVQSMIVQPLLSLGLCMQETVEGNLTRRVEVKGSNEIDEVGLWLNRFTEHVEEIVRQVTRSSRQLGKAAEELAQSARSAADQAIKEQDQASHITTTMSEMSSAIEEISKSTQSAAVYARKAEESAHFGGHTVQTTVHTVEEVLKSNQGTLSRIEELGRSTEAIGRVIEVIDNIAGQTNLLALNAVIEAAHAGQHGRGFAVVAIEVRELASRTSAATKQIHEAVLAIQRGTAEAVEAMRSSKEYVQSGVESARSAGEALTSIIQGSESVQKMVTQIAAAATEQSYSTQSVSANVNEIAAIIRNTAASSQQSVEACQQLAVLANELASLVGVFKVSQGEADRDSEALRKASSAEASGRSRSFGRPIAAMHS